MDVSASQNPGFGVIFMTTWLLLRGVISSAGRELNLNTVVFVCTLRIRSVLDDLQDPSFEILWAELRPARLPRGYNSIVVGTLYHPPSASDPAIMEYLIKCLSTIASCYPNCGILIAWDFNRLQITRLRNNFQLKQIVHFPTRGRRTLDLILTNISEYYQDPIERPPFGLSDHASIELQPKERAHVKATYYHH